MSCVECPVTIILTHSVDRVFSFTNPCAIGTKSLQMFYTTCRRSSIPHYLVCLSVGVVYSYHPYRVWCWPVHEEVYGGILQQAHWSELQVHGRLPGLRGVCSGVRMCVCVCVCMLWGENVCVCVCVCMLWGENVCVCVYAVHAL